jgi:50S ribosomal protein L4, bacterial/organelle
MKLDVVDLTGKKVGDINLADSVFACNVNTQAIFDAVLRQQSSWRQGTHDTKTRAEVSGGGKKPFRQKGTGRARQGSTRAVQYRHGGIAFGPTPRSHTFKLNRKVRRLALRSGLTLKAQEKDLICLDSIVMDEIKLRILLKY